MTFHVINLYLIAVSRIDLGHCKGFKALTAVVGKSTVYVL
jgi:hypothetical protein